MAGEGDNTVDAPMLSAAIDTNGVESGNGVANGNTEPPKDLKRERAGSQDVEMDDSPVKRQKGVAPIKAECVTTPRYTVPSLTLADTSSTGATTRQRSRVRLWTMMQQKPQTLDTKQVATLATATARAARTTKKKTRSKRAKTRVVLSEAHRTRRRCAVLELITMSFQLQSAGSVKSASSNMTYAGISRKADEKT
jgi:hypothetical protein